ncbi:MAG TPA: MFS transporter, partial [Chloroflexota bacterium]|nr:MFS transporter [Chloroflexota bacterium]
AWKDRAGLRTPFLVSVLIFGLGSLACAFAPSMLVLVVSRGFQGLGGGGLTAVSFAAVANYPEGLRIRMYSLNSTLWGVISLGAPLLGGIITDTIGWRWIFLVNMPLCVFVLLLAQRGLAGSQPSDPGRPLPAGRAVLLALTIGAAVAAPSARGYVALPLVAVAIVLGWWYLRQERRAAVAIIPISAWLGRGPVGSTLHATAFFTGSYTAAAVFLPLYLQEVRGESATMAGLALSAGGISWTCGSLIGAQGRGIWQKRMVIVAALMICVGGLAIAAQAWIGRLPLPLIVATWSFAAVGMGMGLIHLMNWAIVFSPASQAGTVSAAVQSMRLIGSAAGAALMGALLHAIGAEQPRLQTSITAIYLLMAFIALCAATVRRPRGVERKGSEPAETPALVAVEA